MSDSAQIILALVGGLGGLYTLGQKLADWLRARAELDRARAAGEASATKKSLRIAGRALEDTGKHVDRWASCEARCRELAERLGRTEERLEDALNDNAELKERLTTAEARERQHLDRIRVLEDDVRKLQARVGIYRGLDNIRRLRPAEEPAKEG